jgi:hypothetical protein
MFSEFMRMSGYTFPAPTEYVVDYEDIDSEKSTRNEAAYLDRDRLRAEVTKIRVGWKVTTAELTDIASHLRPETITLTFWNATTARYETKTMYCSRKSAELLRNDDDPTAGQYWHYTANITEC